MLWTFPFVPRIFTKKFKLLWHLGVRKPLPWRLQSASHTTLLEIAPNVPTAFGNTINSISRCHAHFLNTVRVISYNHPRWFHEADGVLAKAGGNWGREATTARHSPWPSHVSSHTFDHGAATSLRNALKMAPTSGAAAWQHFFPILRVWFTLS